MATILQIKSENDDHIRQKTAPSSITRFEDADLRDAVADELKARGVLFAADTDVLASISNTNTDMVLVKGVGLFRSLETGVAANQITTFESADAGWLWILVLEADQKIEFELSVQDEYVLKDGFRAFEIWWKSDDAEGDAKIGTTDGGDEIMFSDSGNPWTADKWNIMRSDTVADGGDVTIYFRDFTGNVSVKIKKNLI